MSLTENDRFNGLLTVRAGGIFGKHFEGSVEVLANSRVLPAPLTKRVIREFCAALRKMGGRSQCAFIRFHEKAGLPEKRKPKSAEESALKKALRTSLLEAIRGDLTIVKLAQIVRIAESGKEVLAAIDPNQVPLPDKRPRRYFGGGMISNPMYSLSSSEDSDSDGEEDQIPVTNNETFGAKALREILASAREIMKPKDAPLPPSTEQKPFTILTDPLSMVRAIDEAKKAGLDDIAKKLETSLTSAIEPSASKPLDPVPASLLLSKPKKPSKLAKARPS